MAVAKKKKTAKKSKTAASRAKSPQKRSAVRKPKAD
jgi:hypothetical protein